MRYSLYNEIFHFNFETTPCLEVKNKNRWIILQDFFSCSPPTVCLPFSWLLEGTSRRRQISGHLQEKYLNILNIINIKYADMNLDLDLLDLLDTREVVDFAAILQLSYPLSGEPPETFFRHIFRPPSWILSKFMWKSTNVQIIDLQALFDQGQIKCLEEILAVTTVHGQLKEEKDNLTTMV